MQQIQENDIKRIITIQKFYRSHIENQKNKAGDQFREFLRQNGKCITNMKELKFGDVIVVANSSNNHIKSKGPDWKKHCYIGTKCDKENDLPFFEKYELGADEETNYCIKDIKENKAPDCFTSDSR